MFIYPLSISPLSLSKTLCLVLRNSALLPHPLEFREELRSLPSYKAVMHTKLPFIDQKLLRKDGTVAQPGVEEDSEYTIAFFTAPFSNL